MKGVKECHRAWNVARMKNLGIICGAVLFLTCLAGCKTVYIPVQGETVVEYRDSIITKLDTLKVEVKNTEYIRDWTGLLDTLSLSAEGGKIQSRAWVDTTKAALVGELETKPREVDVIVPHTLEYHQKDSTSIEPIIIEEVQIKYKTPRWAWWTLVFNVLGIALLGLKIWLKFKGSPLK